VKTKSLICLSALCCLVPSSTFGTVLGTIDFETGDLSQSSRTQKCCDYSVTVVQSPVRAGAYAMKSYINSTDPTVATHRRAEVGFLPLVSGEYWYGWSNYLPADFAPSSLWHVLTQLHSGLNMSPLQEEIYSNAILFKHFVDGNSASPYVTLWQDNTPSKYYGKWTDYVVHVNWTNDSNVGYFQIWINGVKVTDWHGSTLGGATGAYWKAGLVEDAADTLTAYYDEMRYGDASSSYAEVAPGAHIVNPSIPSGLTVNIH
jgi:hypothetical protein